MGTLGVIVANELRLLFRDKAGLALLFLMPSILVVVVSLVQDNVMKTTGESGVKVLFINRDDGEIGRIIKERLDLSEAVKLVPAHEGMSDEEAAKALSLGEFQVCLIIPKGLGSSLKDRTAYEVRSAIKMDDSEINPGNIPNIPELTIIFDPLMQASFRLSVTNALHRMMITIEMNAKIRAMSEALPKYASRMAESLCMASYPADFFPAVDGAWGEKTLLGLQIKNSGKGDYSKLPTSVQHNAPAWALFGMFFIVVPLSGGLVRERQEGVLKRLMTLPVPYGLLLMGKALAYVAVCLIQFGLILLICKTVLPFLGTDSLEIGSSWGAVATVVLSASLASAGYGIMVGNLAGTYEQASMFGAISVVIAAALGGIMVPVFAMPPVMQEISKISPLGWGLNALTGIFVKGYGLRDVWFEICLLSIFAFLTIAAGRLAFLRRVRSL